MSDRTPPLRPEVGDGVCQVVEIVRHKLAEPRSVSPAEAQELFQEQVIELQSTTIARSPDAT